MPLHIVNITLPPRAGATTLVMKMLVGHEPHNGMFITETRDSARYAQDRFRSEFWNANEPIFTFVHEVIRLGIPANTSLIIVDNCEHMRPMDLARVIAVAKLRVDCLPRLCHLILVNCIHSVGSLLSQLAFKD